MVSEGQFVGLDWNRIARLHSQVLVSTLLFLVLEKLTTLIEDKNMSRNIAWVWLRTHSKSGNSSSLDNLTGSLLSRIHIL